MTKTVKKKRFLLAFDKIILDEVHQLLDGRIFVEFSMLMSL